MPKVNVYLPVDLAEAVREARIPVSAVCQRALEDALRHSTAATESTRALEEAGESDVPFAGRTTVRLRDAVKLAYVAARERNVSSVGTEHLLLGILDERENLAVRVIEALDVEVDDVRRELDALIAQQPVKPAKEARVVMTPLARRAFDLASEESTRLMHNYVGCEHLLLGLVAEEEGMAGRVLRSMGIDKTVTRRAVVTALVGVVHSRREPRPPAAESIGELRREILDRLAAIERKLAH